MQIPKTRDPLARKVSLDGWLIPIAIVITGTLIAVAVYTIHYRAVLNANGNPAAMRPVSTSDHILGNPTAPVMVVEYADPDSEYAKDFEKTMEQVMQNYGTNGDVAWVLRDFPLVSQDTFAEADAEAAECAAAQGGSRAFFKFVDAMQAAAPGDASFDPAGFTAIVTGLDLSADQFNSCVKAHTYEKTVVDDYNNGVAVGATGSPYSILLVKGQKPAIISGSLPYSTMKQVIDQSIAKVLGTNAASTTSSTH